MTFLTKSVEQSLARVELSRDMKVVDVACGPGTASLTIASKVAEIEALDFSESMLDCFRENLSRSGTKNIHLTQGDGQALPYKDASFDLYLSFFGLIFFPDRVKGLKEAWRVLKPGARAVISSWAPIERSSLMQMVMGALTEAVSDLPAPPEDQLAWDREEPIRVAASEAGFEVQEIYPQMLEIEVESIESFWEFFAKGSPPVALIKASKSDSEWAEIEKVVLNYLQANLKAPTKLSSEALISIFRKPG